MPTDHLLEPPFCVQLAGAGAIRGAGRKRRHCTESLCRQQREVSAKYSPTARLGSLRTGAAAMNVFLPVVIKSNDNLLQKHGDVERARQLWSQAYALDPLNAYVSHALSNLERRLRNFDRAKASF